MKIRKKISFLFLITSCLVFSFCFSLSAYAAQSSEEIGFTVVAQLPQNQINSAVSYFDLRMAPKDEQVLEIAIHNTSNAEIEVEVEAITASTNRNGIIDYKTSGIKDEAMEIAFSEIATPIESKLIIPANSTEYAQIQLTMPENLYDGTVLGGILIRKISANKDEVASFDNEKTTTSIENQYNYIIGVKLSETDVEISPDFELISVEPTLFNYHKSIANSIRNPKPIIVKEMYASAEIYKENSNKLLLQNTMESVDMAPNSVFQLPVDLNGQELAPGKYVSKVHLELDGQIWDFEELFEITGEKLEELENGSVEISKSSIPTWGIVLLVSVAVLIILLAILIILLIKKKSYGDENVKK